MVETEISINEEVENTFICDYCSYFLRYPKYEEFTVHFIHFETMFSFYTP